MFARRKFFVFAEVVGPKRFGNGVFFAQPFAEVNQLATMGAKRPVGTGEPIAFLFAGGTFDFANGSHLNSSNNFADWRGLASEVHTRA